MANKRLANKGVANRGVAQGPGSTATNLQRIIWISSYPKSGNTWVRTFLANYFQPPGKALDINSLRQFTTADVRQDFFDRAAGRPFRASTVEEWLNMRPKAIRRIAFGRMFSHSSTVLARNGLRGLSMGMSDDFETAIRLGATVVRVGSAIFGAREAGGG
jgi:hypothetical protein